MHHCSLGVDRSKTSSLIGRSTIFLVLSLKILTLAFLTLPSSLSMASVTLPKHQSFRCNSLSFTSTTSLFARFLSFSFHLVLCCRFCRNSRFQRSKNCSARYCGYNSSPTFASVEIFPHENARWWKERFWFHGKKHRW